MTERKTSAAKEAAEVKEAATKGAAATRQAAAATNEALARPTGNAGTLRLLAIVLWVLGLACEVVGILILLQKLVVSNPVVFIVIALLLDLVLVVAGSFLWKRANKIDPPSEKNPVEFFIKTQLGAIIAVIAFFPILLLLLLDKNLDKRAKTLISILAVVCLAGAVGLSADYDPISLEDLQQMRENAESSDFGANYVKWSTNSKVYHTWATCSALNRISENNLREGTVDEAFEASKARMCKICAGHFNITKGVDGGDVADDAQEALDEAAGDLADDAEDAAGALPAAA
ncbi:MAG: hypothetical protein FWG23_01195 [Eggerthellaceae bacterium]|nr:hypothetical protein [Eggerthellaceae bacterium]